ncbi:FAD/NAD(P)-binding protein [Dyadobacter sp. Leaf189]|uniref:FAD/NAD(P)-binding protein n=1 Tax=Dyadobacter sp. Leaf189 TaxID=1736295 RepID=UPI0006F430BD|nr:FAD/NAD(P)-binding protein [Dyadobacter sp. Leaf189]KQS33949.1 hypothetical protein ASG33_07920 [Dyadobacter sp. Leaf189]
MSSVNITIIGGGACGISAFTELFLQLRIANLHRKVGITIIEENEEVGKGLAFGTKQPGHILNTQADLMGIHLTEPEHFSEWLIRHQERIGEEIVDNQGQDEAFTTRRLYGDYLKEQFEHYFSLAKEEGMQAEVVHASATNVKKEENGFNVFLSNQQTHACNYLVLAPGTPVANNYPHLEGKKNYFGSPWPSSDILENVPRDADVGILGSSLSAIDALMTLADNEHQGKITFYSLDGLLPRVQVEKPEPYQRKYLIIKNLHRIQREKLRNPTVVEVFRLFMKEAESYAGGKIDWKATKRDGKSAAELLREDIETARAGGDALMNIPYSLRYDSSEMWKALDESERIKFKKWLGGYWATNRHGMPLVNAERVCKLFDNQQLSVESDLEEVKYIDEKEGFELRFGDQVNFTKYLINATGPASAVKAMKSDLVKNLAEGKLIEPEPVGGIRMDTQTMQVVTSGKPVPHFYVLGHLCNGLLLDVNAVWFNVRTIGSLSQHILKTIVSENPA